MLSEVLDHFGFARDFYGAGYYETSYHRQVLQNLRGEGPEAAVRGRG